MTGESFIPDRLQNADYPVFADYRDYSDACEEWIAGHPEAANVLDMAGFVASAGYHISEACSYEEEDEAVRLYFAFASTLLKLQEAGVDVVGMIQKTFVTLEVAAPKRKDES